MFENVVNYIIVFTVGIAVGVIASQLVVPLLTGQAARTVPVSRVGTASYIGDYSGYHWSNDPPPISI